jgi:hypothetical protein
MPMASKYRAIRTNGYASKKEARVAQDLQLRQMAGQISDLRERVPFVIAKDPNGKDCITYIADFVFVEGGAVVAMDAKGVRTPVFNLKEKLMKWYCGIEIQEV